VKRLFKKKKSVFEADDIVRKHCLVQVNFTDFSMFHIVQEKKLCLKTVNDKVDKFDNLSSIVRIQRSICNTVNIFLQINVLFKKKPIKNIFV